MIRSVRRVAVLVAATAALCVVVPAAPAQDNLGDVLGTTILNDVLTGIALPQVTYPDPEADGTQPTQTQTQPKTTTTPSVHAAGYYCKGESKRHARGFKGTSFKTEPLETVEASLQHLGVGDR